MNDGSAQSRVRTEVAVPAAGPPDGQVVEDVLAGDTERFGVLVTRYQDRIHNFLLRLTRNPDRANDLTQETFLNAFRKLRQYKPEYAFKSWLFKIAQNCAFMWMRHVGRRPEGRLPLQTLRSQGDDPATEAHKRAFWAQLDECLDSLEAPFHATVLLRHQEGLSLAEVAEALDVSLGTVKSRLSRAYKRLRNKLEAKGAVAP